MENQTNAPELNDLQIERIDEIHNAVYALCEVLTENEELEWNMAYIGEIADLACEILHRQGHRVRYPAIIEDAGAARIIDYLDEE